MADRQPAIDLLVSNVTIIAISPTEAVLPSATVGHILYQHYPALLTLFSSVIPITLSSTIPPLPWFQRHLWVCLSVQY